MLMQQPWPREILVCLCWLTSLRSHQIKIPLAICILITKYAIQFNVYMYFFFRWEGAFTSLQLLGLA